MAKDKTGAATPARKRYQTLEEVADEWFRSSTWTVRRAVERGELPFVRVPGTRRMLFDPADLERIFEESRVDVTAA
jgi:excisionase family DNA binding protein